MRFKISALAAGCALLSGLSVTSPAGAAFGGTVPVISGVYIVNYTETCQAVQVGINPGKVSTQTLTLTFNPTKHVATYSGAKTSGALIVWKGLVGGALSRKTVSGSWSFSNTATTLTINAGKFDVAYGPLVNQIPQSMVFSGMSSPDCAASATVIRVHA